MKISAEMKTILATTMHLDIIPRNENYSCYNDLDIILLSLDS